MKLAGFYDLVVMVGKKKDPRTKKEIVRELKKARREYKRLKGVDKYAYDMEMLKHPYADTRILYGNPAKEVKTIMVGIDMETPELLLAERMIEKGLAIDLVLAHHPEGLALANFYQVMQLHKKLLTNAGLKKEIVDSLIDERIKEVSRSVSSVNHTRSVEAARFLDIAYMCAHTPADNHGASYLQSLFEKKKPKKVLLSLDFVSKEMFHYSDINSLDSASLKDILKHHGLSQVGKKNDLKERILSQIPFPKYEPKAKSYEWDSSDKKPVYLL